MMPEKFVLLADWLSTNLMGRLSRKRVQASLIDCGGLIVLSLLALMLAHYTHFQSPSVNYLSPGPFLLLFFLIRKNKHSRRHKTALLVSAATATIVGYSALYSWERGLTESIFCLIYGSVYYLILRGFHYVRGEIRLLNWLKSITAITLIANPGIAFIYYQVCQRLQIINPINFDDVILRDFFSTVLLFTYLVFSTSKDIKISRSKRAMRELTVIFFALTLFVGFVIGNFQFPFLLIALPLTLLALYLNLPQTGLIIGLSLFVFNTLINFNIIQAASPLFSGDVRELTFTITLVLIFPLIASIAITETRQRQNKILGLSNRLELATSANGLGIWEWDLESGDFYWDEQMHRLFNLDKSEAQTAPEFWQQWIDSEDREKFEGAMLRAKAGIPIAKLDFKVKTPKGKSKTLSSSATPIRDDFNHIQKVMGITQDVSEARYTSLLIEQKNKMAKRAQQEFVLLFEMAPGPLLLVSHEGVIKKANSATHSLFGFQDGELLSSDISVIFDNLILDSYYDLNSLEMGSAVSPYQTYEILAQKKDGQSLQVEFHAQPILSNNESLLIVSLRDLTEQKRVEHAIQEAQIQAERANQAKSEFIANMSHEIRTPLNAVLGSVKLLQNTTLTDMQLDYLTMIRNSGEALLGILNDILDISKIEAGRMELSPIDFNLDDVLARIAAIMSINSGNKKIDLIIACAAQMPNQFYGDPIRLQQILVNLVGNAVKFTESGFVRLNITHQVQYDGKLNLAFSVEDTGIGISQAQQERLFHAFSQGDNSITRRYGGSGLGLLITKRLIEMMSGEIQLKSELNQGSCFSVNLQLDPPRAARPNSSFNQQYRVKIFHDSKPIAQALHQHCQRWRWDCDVHSSTAPLLVGDLGSKNQTHTDAFLVASNLLVEDSQHPHDILGKANLRHATAIIAIDRGLKRDQLNDQLKRGMIDAIIYQPVTATVLYDSVSQAKARANGIAIPTHHESLNEPLYLQGLNLLLVEDNIMNQTVALGLLEQYGAKVDIADDAEQAIEILQENANVFDTVLMDIQMPGMDGYSATRIIRQKLDLHLPILAMTAGVTASEKDLCLSAGMQGFIAKPIDVEDMLNAILRACERPSVEQFFEQGLPSEGINTKIFNPNRLLKYVKGDSDRHNDIVKMIANVIARGTAPLQEAQTTYLRGDKEEARRLFHSLKGSMGNIGALEVWEFARRLEEAVSNPNLQQDFQSLLEQAFEAYKTMLTEGHKWLDLQQITHAKKPKQLDQESYFEALFELQKYLLENNIQALDIYEDIREEIFKALALNQQSDMEQAMQNLDFGKANTIIETHIFSQVIKGPST